MNHKSHLIKVRETLPEPICCPKRWI